jgi:hypothetical protein
MFSELILSPNVELVRLVKKHYGPSTNKTLRQRCFPLSVSLLCSKLPFLVHPQAPFESQKRSSSRRINRRSVTTGESCMAFLPPYCTIHYSLSLLLISVYQVKVILPNKLKFRQLADLLVESTRLLKLSRFPMIQSLRIKCEYFQEEPS